MSDQQKKHGIINSFIKSIPIFHSYKLKKSISKKFVDDNFN